MKRINIKCPYCGARAFLRPASLVRRRAQPGEEVYACAQYPACDAYVSAHQGSHLPMGTLANKPLRNKRRQALLSTAELIRRAEMGCRIFPVTKS